MSDGFRRVQTAKSLGSVIAHQHCLIVGTTLGSIGQAVFAYDNRRANLALRVVVVIGDVVIVEERQQMLRVFV